MGMNNIYLVVSEVIKDYSTNCCSLDPPEDYRIVGLVVARNNAQAKYLIWKNDDSFEIGDMTAMPRFRTMKVSNDDRGLGVGVINDSYKEEYDALWEVGEKIEVL